MYNNSWVIELCDFFCAEANSILKGHRQLIMLLNTARPLWREFDSKITKGRPVHFSNDDGGAHEPYIK